MNESNQSLKVENETGNDGDNNSNETVVRVVLRYDGMEAEFEMKPDETIIEAAQNAGYFPPYSCQMAYCATCRARLEEGRVEMADSDILTEEEMEEGYVLTCQSHPRTKRVVLDYDV